MFQKFRKKVSMLLAVIFILLSILAVYVYIGTTEAGIQFLTGMDYEGVGSVTEPQIYEMDIPDDYMVGDALCIRTAQQELSVYARGELIYEYKRDFSDVWGKSAVSRWNIIALDEEYESITLRLTTPYESYYNYKNIIIYGNTLDITEYIVARSIPAVTISMIAIVAGVAVALCCMAMSNMKENREISYFCLVLVLAGIWSFGESNHIFYYFVPMHIERFITFVAVYLMPVFLFMSIAEWMKGCERKIFYVLGLVSAFVAMAAVTLQLLEVLDLIEVLIFSHILLVFGLLLFLIYLGKLLLRNNDRRYKYSLIGLIILVLFIFIEVGIFVFGAYAYLSTPIRVTLVFIAIFAVAYLIKYAFAMQRNLFEIKESLERSRVELLSSRMKPHLIQNTLLAIQELCYVEPIKAVDAIGSLSKYLRTTFSLTSDKKMISFTSELEYIHAYIEIQKICYGDEVNFIEDIEVEDFYIPTMTLQPIVENAVKHGIRKKIGVGHVRLSTTMQGDNVMVTISDDGVGFDNGKEILNSLKRIDSDRGMIIRTSSENIYYRLKYLAHASLDIKSEVGIGTTVTIVLPKRKG